MNEQEMYDRISIINVKNKLNLQEVYSIGDTIYVRCPFCFSKNGSMKLNISNNSYVCNNCEESGYSIGLYAKCNYISNRKAYQKLITREADLDTIFKNKIMTNTKKNSEELDEAYTAFLHQLELSNEHTRKLLTLGFTIEEIEQIGFKTIPTSEEKRILICRKLLQDGIELQGIPGFYQDSRFRWSFKSHKGIFVPIKNNCKIEAIRIHLDNPYKDTTDIWFSSGDKNNGSKINNQIMMLLPKCSQLQIFNNNKSEKEIVIVSEMILAYKLFYALQNKVVIGIPNVFAKNEIKKLDRIKQIRKIYLVMDKYTIIHNAVNLIKRLTNKYGKDKIKILHLIKDCEIPSILNEINKEERKAIINKNIA